MDYQQLYPFWSNLNQNEKDYIISLLHTEKYDKGMLMHQGEENCKGIITVLSGQLRAYILSDEGREVTLFRVYQNDVCVLAASCLMDSIEFDILIEATDMTEVLILPSVCLNQIVKSNPYVELYLYKTAAEKFSEVMWTMQQILFKKIDQRVAHFLWDEYVRNSNTELKVTHDEVAKYIGSSREVVTKVLKYLAGYQVVELGRGKIVILDKEKLKKFL